ncbi:MAG: helix-turn-helix transcriptional regulator [Cyanobacteria bacterium J06643_13]
MSSSEFQDLIERLRHLVAQDTSKSDASVGDLEELILTTLLSSELYGLQIVSILEQTTGRRYSTGTVYPALNRLEQKGLIFSTDREENIEERKGARRKYYKISALGGKCVFEAEQIRQKLYQKSWNLAT